MRDLGGFVRDPGAMVWAIQRRYRAQFDHRYDGPVEARTCDVRLPWHAWLYALGRRQTWSSTANRRPGAGLDAATQTVAETIIAAMKPGARISERKALGRATTPCGSSTPTTR